MRYFVELSYSGTNYRGWQRQPDAPSVQQTLEEALSRLTGAPIEVTGAGRTDTGVHAAHYVAHFDLASEPDSDFLYHANAILPPDIALKRIWRVADDAHARFDATEREYTYYITPTKDPFRTSTAWYYSVPLDIEAMNRAAAYLLSVSDFTSFAKLGGGNKTNICHVTKAVWEEFATTSPSLCEGTPPSHGGERPPHIVTFVIRSDRFLRNMVRAIVGTLVDVGRGKISVDDFIAIVDSRNLSRSSGGAPAHGLFLTDIKY
jgi:tRNA pseudouridine38-40 synthase